NERGHIMFMHNDDVSVVNSAFFGLGRTDKTTPVDDFVTGGHTGTNRIHVDSGEIGAFDPDTDLALETADHLVTNQRGRYPLHIHQAGVGESEHTEHGVIGPCPITGESICACGDADDHDMAGDHDHGVMGPCPKTGDPICLCGEPDGDQDGDGIPDSQDDDHFDGAYLAGNVVWGSPGWGYVHHSSNAMLESNLAFDVSGSAFVAESGDETGRWEDNLAIGTSGFNIEKTEDSDQFNADDGGEGNGYYLRARGIEVVDNAAHSSARAGFYYHNNGVDFEDTVTSSLDEELDGLGHGLDAINTEDIPIRVFEGNAVVAAKEALRIVTDPLDAVRKFNDAWSHLKDFTATAVDEAGVSITYSSKYIFENFQIYGTEDKITPSAQQANAGFYFKASVADITIIDSHVENFDHAFTNWLQVGDRQEYRRGYWDPKNPANWHPSEVYDGLGNVEGIENAAYNLWNTNLVNLTFKDLEGRAIRSPKIEVETDTGGTQKVNVTKIFDPKTTTAKEDGVSIELLGDSRDGGLVALWREDLANDPDQKAVLQDHIPLAYQESVYLSIIHTSTGDQLKRAHYEDYTKGINADIWSGTALEFAKEDSLGRHVFLYDDFSPVDPSKLDRAVTTNEKILFTKDMIDGVLASEGYVTVAGVSSMKFVVMKMVFTDRLTGELETKKFLVGLDLAWEMPEGTFNAGLMSDAEGLIVAEQYLVFSDGVAVPGRGPIIIKDHGDITTPGAEIGQLITEGDDVLDLSSARDVVNAGGGNDIVRGLAAADFLDGGAGHDALFGGDGVDHLFGGADQDFLTGEDLTDYLYGGGGDDRLQGGAGRDRLFGGEGDDEMLAGVAADFVDGGEGNDILDGEQGNDRLGGGDGHDHVVGGLGDDRLLGQNGDDVVSGGAGVDEVFGGAGSDLMHGGAGHDQMFGGINDDVMLGAGGNDSMFGGHGADLLNGGTGHDTLSGGLGNDVLEGGVGLDSLSGDEGDDALFGGNGADRLFGKTGNDDLFGGDAQDRIFGAMGDDLLDGGEHADQLFGGAGADRIVGGGGNDELTGGRDADVFAFEANSGSDVITDFEDGVDAIEFLIESFGFEDLRVVQREDDTLVVHAQGSVRLEGVNAEVIDINDFQFIN
ncbi:MAG: hypothetical protein AAFV19_12485, partial [Pseudomonadota bacterium]